MMRTENSIVFVLVVWLSVMLVTPLGASEKASRDGHFAPLDDIRMYYEISGQGHPLLLIHGAYGSVELWDSMAPLLSETSRVIAMDSRGRARTNLGNGPITYGRMAHDIIGLMDYLGIEQADVVGHSMGGATTLNLLVDFPDRVRTATLIGTTYNVTEVPERGKREIDVFDQLRTGEADVAGMREKFLTHHSESEFLRVLDSLEATVFSQPTFTPAVLATISRPTLVIKTDKDSIIPAASFERMAEAIPGSKVLHIPEATHSVPREYPELLAREITEFIRKAQSTP